MTATATETPLARLAETVAAAQSERGGSTSVAVADGALRPGEMTPLHTHTEDEALHVLEGALTVYAGGAVSRVEAGGRIVLPRGVAHTQRADGEGARYVSLTFARSPARYRDFARAVARPGDTASTTWPSADELAALTAIADANGIVVEGPPGALPVSR